MTTKENKFGTILGEVAPSFRNRFRQTVLAFVVARVLRLIPKLVFEPYLIGRWGLN